MSNPHQRRELSGGLSTPEQTLGGPVRGAIDVSGLDQDQRKVFQKVVTSIRSTLANEKELEERYFFITGDAGCGKSFLLKSIIHEIGTEPANPVILAWTGMAAKQVGGLTIQSYFRLAFDKTGMVGDNAFMRSTVELTRRMVMGIKGSDEEKRLKRGAVIYVDEVGAVHHSVLDAISETIKIIRQGMPSSHLPFGGLPVVLSGDPCQIGRVSLFEGSSRYSPEQYPTRPFWESACWGEMRPTIMYLTKFNRGSDSEYLGLLKEIRRSTSEDDGVPKFSSSSVSVLSKIRDRDGGAVMPRFNHTVICLRNKDAEEHNHKHIHSLPGPLHKLMAIDTEASPLPPCFQKKDVDGMGYRAAISLTSALRSPKLGLNFVASDMNSLKIAERRTPCPKTPP
ncbi:hypothetical protein FOL47_005370 [Perkinsus chesapeaki]|uniref:ATP-dependent DNA helicase n=1 Tax=Perkinsus chesapeaki TaxID=330153 RepID=A0A7J6N573_PERCH|nr:hypothetical protein FOL47_005370 [Perkinsus chesapeaki]